MRSAGPTGSGSSHPTTAAVIGGPGAASGSPSTWTNVSSSSGPTPRTDAAGAFDPQLGGLLIFGGRSPDGSALGDTWINAGGAWSYRSTGEGALSPSARWGAALTYDSAGGFLLLFGGRNSSNTLGDTWAFNATGWHPLSSPSAPSGRAFASIAYDPDLSAVVLFGGLTGGAIPTTSNQTWLFDSTGWVDATGQFDSPPAARAWAAEAYDASDGYLLLFGGSSSPSSQVPLGGTWILSPRGWWNASKPDAPGPTARLGASLAFDASTGSLVLFGGAAASPTEPDAFPADTWSFAAGVWNDLSAGLAMHPPGREGAVWAPAGSGLLLFGGDTGSPAAARADAWRFSAQVLSVSLTATPTAGPAPLNVSFVLSVSGGATPYTVSWQFGDGAVSATLGPVNHVYVLPGEFTASVTVRDSSADSSVQAIPISVLTDWQGAHQWSSVDAAGSAAPSPRASSQIAYDAALQAVILFGGETAPGAAASDTWEFVNNVWINLTSSLPVSPSGRYGGAMVYDSVDSVLLLFGGTTGATTLNDTWTFDGSTWTEILPITAPSPRAFAQMSYDPIDGYVVLFGGGAAPVASVAPPIDSDTWEFRAGVWVNITSQLSIAPPPTTGGTFTWDPQDGVLVLSGGSSIAATGAPGTCYPDGLTWSFVAGAWTAQEKTAPTGRVFGMAAYDGTDHVVLVFGGSESRSGRCTVADDSWSYVGGGWSNLSGAIPFPPASRDRAGLAFDAAEGVDVLFGGASAGVLLNDTWLYPAELNSSTTSTTTNTTGSGNLSSGPPPSPGGSGGNGPPGTNGGSTPVAPFAVGYSLSSVASTGPLTVTFVATSLGGVAPFSFSWNFGDSSPPMIGSTVSHRYTVAGTFVPVLTAADANGATVVAVLASIHVSPSPSIGLGITPTEGASGPSLAEWATVGLAAGGAVLAGLVIALRKQELRHEQEGEENDLAFD